ncbi:MAG: HXXEE domain-containing protein [Vicinamibacteria bacterium]
MQLTAPRAGPDAEDVGPTELGSEGSCVSAEPSGPVGHRPSLAVAVWARSGCLPYNRGMAALCGMGGETRLPDVHPSELRGNPCHRTGRLCVAGGALSWRQNRTVVFLYLTFFFLPSMLWNTVFHVGATLVFGAYCPGVVTAVFLYPPLVWLMMRSSLSEGLLTPRAATAALALAGVFHFWEVGHNVFRVW